MPAADQARREDLPEIWQTASISSVHEPRGIYPIKQPVFFLLRDRVAMAGRRYCPVMWSQMFDTMSTFYSKRALKYMNSSRSHFRLDVSLD